MVIHHGNGNGLDHFTQGERQIGGHRRIIHTSHASVITRGEGHQHRAGAIRIGPTRTAGAENGEENICGILIHGVSRRNELNGPGATDGTAVNPGEIRVGLMGILGESAPDNDFLIQHVGRGIAGNGVLLNQYGGHKAVGPVTKIDGGIHRTIGE